MIFVRPFNLKHDQMRTFYALLLSCAALSSQAQNSITTLNNSTFSPAELTIELGESVTFNVSGAHTATQVSQETWMANSNLPLPGGFDYSAGTHEYMPTEVDTIYFVCQPHAGMGMKGMIIVENTTSIDEEEATPLRIYPNPVSDEVTIETSGTNEFVLIDMQGREVLRRMVNTNDRINVAQIPEGNYNALLKDREGNVTGTQRLTIAR